MNSTRHTLFPVILSGGAGSRLWPMSREALPKQLLPLISDQTMLQETVLRLANIPAIEPPLLVCNNEHRFLAAEQLMQIGVKPLALMLEPLARNTAAAIAAAAKYLYDIDPDAMMLVLPADHLIENLNALSEAVEQARQIAAQDFLVTFGLVPNSPETGYGYIHKGEAISGLDSAFRVDSFKEKPDYDTACRYVDDGGYYWNSGMFVFKASVFLEELNQYEPEIALASANAVKLSQTDFDFTRLDQNAFAQSPSKSIDYAVMERTTKAAVVPVSMGWSDIGSWSSLWMANDKDGFGNVKRGDVFSDQSMNCFLRAESRALAVIGVEDLIVVETSDAVLVVHQDYAEDVKNVVEHLKAQNRTEHLQHSRVYRPWGWYESIDSGERFLVKRIMVNPGAKLSLQMHHHRAEHWVVVSGTALISSANESKLLNENQSTYIPVGEIHRLENPGKMPLHLIEVQSGSYLSEDDIVRLDDNYNR
jgi:mannose-1-phosphate guanylyltransferase/mannose-6-phosphate isomerase